jgi:hypothetical protein
VYFVENFLAVDVRDGAFWFQVILCEVEIDERIVDQQTFRTGGANMFNTTLSAIVPTTHHRRLAKPENVAQGDYLTVAPNFTTFPT